MTDLLFDDMESVDDAPATSAPQKRVRVVSAPDRPDNPAAGTAWIDYAQRQVVLMSTDGEVRMSQEEAMQVRRASFELYEYLRRQSAEGDDRTRA